MSLVNTINAKLHQKPIDFIVDGLYWCFILWFGGITAAVIQIFLLGYKICMHFSGDPGDKYVELKDNEKNPQEQNPKRQLGVVITGCDSGFGQELALELLKKKDFVVFCGCLQDESLENIRNMNHSQYQ
jgi:hypothetical protein